MVFLSSTHSKATFGGLGLGSFSGVLDRVFVVGTGLSLKICRHLSWSALAFFAFFAAVLARVIGPWGFGPGRCFLYWPLWALAMCFLTVSGRLL